MPVSKHPVGQAATGAERMDRREARDRLRGRNMQDFDDLAAVAGGPGNEECGLFQSCVECTIESYTVR